MYVSVGLKPIQLNTFSDIEKCPLNICVGL